MNRYILGAIGLGCVSLLGGPLQADGDPAAGEKAFRQCSACHTLDGSNRVGPTLLGVIGRTAGTVDGFRYSDTYVAAGEAGVVWDSETIFTYLEDPNAFLKQATGSDRVKTRMPNKYPDEQLRLDIVAYLGQASGG